MPQEATLARRDARPYETGDQLLKRALLKRRKRWSGRGHFAEASIPEGAELPSIPEGWAWTNLDAVAEIKGGITKDQKRKPDNARVVPYLRVANVQRGYLDLREMKEILWQPRRRSPNWPSGLGTSSSTKVEIRDKLGSGLGVGR